MTITNIIIIVIVVVDYGKLHKVLVTKQKYIRNCYYIRIIFLLVVLSLNKLKPYYILLDVNKVRLLNERGYKLK